LKNRTQDRHPVTKQRCTKHHTSAGKLNCVSSVEKLCLIILLKEYFEPFTETV